MVEGFQTVHHRSQPFQLHSPSRYYISLLAENGYCPGTKRSKGLQQLLGRHKGYEICPAIPERRSGNAQRNDLCDARTMASVVEGIVHAVSR